MYKHTGPERTDVEGEQTQDCHVKADHVKTGSGQRRGLTYQSQGSGPAAPASGTRRRVRTERSGLEQLPQKPAGHAWSWP